MSMSFDPFAELERITQTLGGAQGSSPRFMPVDLYREKDQYVLSADLPGADPGSIDIDVDGQLLTIRAERTPAMREGSQWLSRERAYGSYLRQFSLGEGVDRENINAAYDNGVLSVILPVSERAKPRKISVQAGGEQTSLSA